MKLYSYSYTLREKCPNTKLFLVRIFPHSDWIRRDRVPLFIQSECGKIRSRKNSVFGHFSRSDSFSHVFLVSETVTLIFCFCPSAFAPAWVCLIGYQIIGDVISSNIIYIDPFHSGVKYPCWSNCCSFK